MHACIKGDAEQKRNCSYLIITYFRFFFLKNSPPPQPCLLLAIVFEVTTKEQFKNSHVPLCIM